jgi:hypothetical protein
MLHYHGILDSVIPPCLDADWVVNGLFPDLELKVGFDGIDSQLSMPRRKDLLSSSWRWHWEEQPWMRVVNRSRKLHCEDNFENDVCLSSDLYMYESLQTRVERYNAGQKTARLEEMEWKRVPLSPKFNLSESTFGANIACTNVTRLIRVCLVDTNHLLPFMRPFSSLRFVQGSVGRLVYIEAILSWLAEHDL